MWKMMKYEYRKGLFPMLIILAVFAMLEVLFLYGIFTKDETKTALGITLLIFSCVIAYVFVLVYGIVNYANDLKNKSGYLTFMAPISSYAIIGAKLLSVFLTGATFVGVIVFLGILDYSIAAEVYHLESLVDMLSELFVSITGVQLKEVVFAIFSLILCFLIQISMVVTVAYFAISVSSTVLQNKKGKGLLTCILFFVLYGCINSAALTIVGGVKADVIQSNLMDSLAVMWPVEVFYLAVAVVAFLLSGLLLDKKISL